MKKYLKHKIRKAKKMLGFTLAESMVTLGIVSFALVSGTTILTIALKAVAMARAKTAAMTMANEFVELYRNIPYDQIGTTTGWPVGAIPSSQQVTRSGLTFTVTTRVDFVDDPFDGNVAGTIPGKPRDTAPNDYKKMEVKILSGNRLLSNLTAIAAAKGLEAAPNTGSLILKVFDSAGQPVPEATVVVTNTTTSPQINITNTTDIDGNLQLLSLPPATDSYHISITKSGYTTDATENPQGLSYTPLNPDLSISAASVIEASFAIDHTSAFVVKTISQTCQPIANRSFQLTGEWIKGINPNTVNYSATHQTDGNGAITLQNMRWDTYNLGLTDQAHDIAGGNPSAIVLPAGVTQDLTLILAPHTANSLLVTVNDANTGLPITDAAVNLSQDGTPVDTGITGRGFFTQTDWSNGAGQTSFADPKKYWSNDANIDIATTAGSIMLPKQTESFAFDEIFSSTTYQDIGATTAIWDGSGIISIPQTDGVYDAQAAVQTLKINQTAGWITEATVQAVDNANGGTIRYLLSTDGGINFNEIALGAPYTLALNGGDLRLRIELETTDPAKTPTVDETHIAYTIESYKTPGLLESSTFDTGGGSVFQKIQWEPANQLPETGSSSVKFQVAANNDNATWNFVGPDNTALTYYAAPGTELGTIFNNNRYIRYRLFLSTDDPRYSSTLSNIALGYTAGCTPPGQVFFGSLSHETYTIDVSKTGYTAESKTIDISGQVKETFNLTPGT